VKFFDETEIDAINEQLTIRTDYESDAHMKLIERVSDFKWEIPRDWGSELWSWSRENSRRFRFMRKILSRQTAGI
jgi:ATP-binding cassette subfamily F protein 3